MTAQIIFPKQDTYWILTDGVSYFDGLTAANCVTTVGSSTQIYWIGTSHEEYAQACLNIGLTPRNTGPSSVISVNPETPALILEEKIKDLQSKLEASQTLQKNIDSDISDLQHKLSNIPEQVNVSNIEDINTRIDSLESAKVNISNLQDINTRIDSLESAVSGVRISARQARLWLIQNGIDLSLVDSTIDTIEDPILKESIKVEWEYAPYVEKSSDWIKLLASKLGLSESDLDRAFTEGANI
jgi:hypothetical protein